jgi:hypothetical protein
MQLRPRWDRSTMARACAAGRECMALHAAGERSFAKEDRLLWMNLRPETARPNVARAKVGRSGKAYFLKCMCSAKDNRQPVTQRLYRSSVSPELRYGHWEIDLPSANANRPSTKAQRKLASVSRSIREPLQELLQTPPRVPKTLAHEQVIPAARLFNRRRNPVRGRRAYQWPKTAVNDPAVLGSDNDALPEGAMPG